MVVSDRIAKIFKRSRLIKLSHFICPRFSIGFDMLVFFVDLSLMDFQVRCMACFHLFLVIGLFLKIHGVGRHPSAVECINSKL